MKTREQREQDELRVDFLKFMFQYLFPSYEGSDEIFDILLTIETLNKVSQEMTAEDIDSLEKRVALLKQIFTYFKAEGFPISTLPCDLISHLSDSISAIRVDSQTSDIQVHVLPAHVTRVHITNGTKPETLKAFQHAQHISSVEFDDDIDDNTAHHLPTALQHNAKISGDTPLGMVEKLPTSCHGVTLEENVTAAHLKKLPPHIHIVTFNTPATPELLAALPPTVHSISDTNIKPEHLHLLPKSIHNITLTSKSTKAFLTRIPKHIHLAIITSDIADIHHLPDHIKFITIAAPLSNKTLVILGKKAEHLQLITPLDDQQLELLQPKTITLAPTLFKKHISRLSKNTKQLYIAHSISDEELELIPPHIDTLVVDRHFPADKLKKLPHTIKTIIPHWTITHDQITQLPERLILSTYLFGHRKPAAAMLTILIQAHNTRHTEWLIKENQKAPPKKVKEKKHLTLSNANNEQPDQATLIIAKCHSLFANLEERINAIQSPRNGEQMAWLSDRFAEIQQITLTENGAALDNKKLEKLIPKFYKLKSDIEEIYNKTMESHQALLKKTEDTHISLQALLDEAKAALQKNDAQKLLGLQGYAEEDDKALNKMREELQSQTVTFDSFHKTFTECAAEIELISKKTTAESTKAKPNAIALKLEQHRKAKEAEVLAEEARRKQLQEEKAEKQKARIAKKEAMRIEREKILADKKKEKNQQKSLDKKPQLQSSKSAERELNKIFNTPLYQNEAVITEEVESCFSHNPFRLKIINDTSISPKPLTPTYSIRILESTDNGHRLFSKTKNASWKPINKGQETKNSPRLLGK